MNNRSHDGNSKQNWKENTDENGEGNLNPRRTDLNVLVARRRARGATRWLPLCLALLSGLSASACTAQALPRSLSFLDACGGDTPDNSNGPVRMARLSYLSGKVTWRGGTSGDWSPVGSNMPLRQGAQVYVAENSKAEIQFDDGSRMRLGGNTFVTLQTLYSDNDGEFTEITLNDGNAYLRLKNKYSVYQVNTPEASLKAVGPARLRVGAGEGAQFAVRRGTATVEGTGGSATLTAGEYLDLANSQSPYQPSSLPNPDSWDSWNETRDRHYDQLESSQSHYVPENIGLVGDDLGDYGTWHDDPTYGHVWNPRVSDSDWRPYRAGNWTWVEPFGWTWVASEPWGWAPYHYGTWVHRDYGWGWVPGPTQQYWSPAVVSYSQRGSDIAWCPLAPAEVRYPAALTIGFGGGNWSAFFSIGAAAVYYPTGSNYCVARPWGNSYINRVTYVTNNYNSYHNNFGGQFSNHNTYINNRNFIPANARVFGATQTSVQNFGGRGGYQPVTRTGFGVFTNGRAIGAPANGGRILAGPQAVAVTRQAFTPTRTFQPATHVQQQFATRAVFRAPLPANVPRAAAPALQGQHFTATRAVGKSGITPGRVAAAAGLGAAALRAAHNNAAARPTSGSFTGNRPTATRPAGNVPVTRSAPADASPALRQYLQQRNAGRLPAKNAPNRPIAGNTRAAANNTTAGAIPRPNRSAPTVSRPIHRAPQTVTRPAPANTNRNAAVTRTLPHNAPSAQSAPRSHASEASSRPTPRTSVPRAANNSSFGNSNRAAVRPAPSRPAASTDEYRSLHTGSFSPRPQPQQRSQPRPQPQVRPQPTPQPRPQPQAQPRPQPRPQPAPARPAGGANELGRPR